MIVRLAPLDECDREGRKLAIARIGPFIEPDAPTLRQLVPGAIADVNEDISATIIRRDEAVASVRVPVLHNPSRH
jgi:hypothetical protein